MVNSMKKRIAIITARGGSKRIPKKNIKEFCGAPIISYSIKAAIESGMFDEVMVSTDSQEIADMAKKYGANVPFMRSAETANDYATTNQVLMEVLEEYKKRGKEFDCMCCIYPTAPFVTANKLKEAINLMDERNPVGIIPVVQFSFPPQRCYVIDNNMYMGFKYPEYMNSRSQDLEKMYHDAGQFYVYDVKKFFELKGVIKENIMPIILPESEVQDIDNEEDWKIAELKYRIINE